ncbi:NnrS family protein [Thalassotalea nanhaiensis]|uniref:NnrS family protein n=1 Tax=Thalassotalea nanhaiensis TaxID=3065648 RepID=A0ABY9TGX0_9GAMM|nr:NnrS family protein [Colwelliaceae bacterium SQ345]
MITEVSAKSYLMQITDLSQEQNITPFFRLGFRPFFTFGAAFSIVALLIWSLTLSGKINLNLYGGGTVWHAHEMIFGFVCAIIVGFLLTAVQTWTGQRAINGKPLMMLVLLWLAGRFVMAFPDILGNATSALIDIAFLPFAAICLALPIIKSGNKRNLFFVPLLLVFTLTNALMHLAINGTSTINVTSSTYIAVMLVTLLMSIMSGRVTPMFTANGTQTSKVSPLKWLEYTTNGSLMLIVACYLVHPFFAVSDFILAVLFLISGITQMFRWLRWKPWITLYVPLLWSLHSALFFIWIGLLALSLGHFVEALPLNHIWHLLTVGGMGGLILAMISRVSLGHTGQKLQPAKIMSFAFVLIFFSAVLRVLGPWLMPEHYSFFINFSVICWLGAYGIFTIIYGPMLLKPRQDGHPG